MTAGSRKRIALVNRALTPVLLVLMPKCPVCAAAYVGLFAAIGLSMGLVLQWVTTVLICMACVILVRWLALWLQSGSWAPFALGAAGLGVSLVGRFMLAYPSVAWAGAAVFAGAACVDFKMGKKRPHAA